MSGEKFARLLTGLAVLAVAGISAAVSYGHIYELTLALHQSVLNARLMPVAIDGLITVGSVVLLQSGSRLGWLGVGPGLALSVFANVESGIGHGALSAVWAGIPALSFFLATFIFERWLAARSKATPVPSAEGATETVAAVPTTPVGTQETVSDPVPPGVPGDTPITVPSVPEDGPEDTPLAVPAPVPAVPLRPVARRAPRRTSPGKPKGPERVFAAEIQAGTLPSLRQVKERMHVGTDRARSIRDQLAQVLQEAPEAA